MGGWGDGGTRGQGDKGTRGWGEMNNNCQLSTVNCPHASTKRKSLLEKPWCKINIDVYGGLVYWS